VFFDMRLLTSSCASCNSSRGARRDRPLHEVVEELALEHPLLIAERAGLRPPAVFAMGDPEPEVTARRPQPRIH
jgi:hypothetical protein